MVIRTRGVMGIHKPFFGVVTFWTAWKLEIRLGVDLLWRKIKSRLAINAKFSV